MQIDAIGERTVSTLIDAVRSIGERMEDEKQEDRRNDHNVLYKSGNGKIYETLV